jgi:hypothetical protein
VVSPGTIKSEGLLYEFLQRELWQEDVWLFQSLASRLIVKLGIWIAPQTYTRLPWLVPYARRDPNSRGSKKDGQRDQWGSADDSGYFRDDNSLLKGLPRSMPVRSALAAYSGRQLRTGFIAAHVWRKVKSDTLAARLPLTYSFVPNVVWLPSDVAKLTDREGSFAQQFVQAIAFNVYRHVPVAHSLKETVEEAWDLLPQPATVPSHALPEASSLNYFVPKPEFFVRRHQIFTDVARALRSPETQAKVVSKRYAPSLAAVPQAARTKLARHLELLAAAMSDEAATGPAPA